MDNEKLRKANYMDGQIDAARKRLSLFESEYAAAGYCDSRHNGSVNFYADEEIGKTLLIIGKAHYTDKLAELEKQFKEL